MGSGIELSRRGSSWKGTPLSARYERFRLPGGAKARSWSWRTGVTTESADSSLVPDLPRELDQLWRMRALPPVRAWLRAARADGERVLRTACSC